MFENCRPFRKKKLVKSCYFQHKSEYLTICLSLKKLVLSVRVIVVLSKLTMVIIQHYLSSLLDGQSFLFLQLYLVLLLAILRVCPYAAYIMYLFTNLYQTLLYFRFFSSLSKVMRIVEYQLSGYRLDIGLR